MQSSCAETDFISRHRSESEGEMLHRKRVIFYLTGWLTVFLSQSFSHFLLFLFCLIMNLLNRSLPSSVGLMSPKSLLLAHVLCHMLFVGNCTNEWSTYLSSETDEFKRFRRTGTKMYQRTETTNSRVNQVWFSQEQHLMSSSLLSFCESHWDFCWCLNKNIETLFQDNAYPLVYRDPFSHLTSFISFWDSFHADQRDPWQQWEETREFKFLFLFPSTVISIFRSWYKKKSTTTYPFLEIKILLSCQTLSLSTLQVLM